MSIVQTLSTTASSSPGTSVQSAAMGSSVTAGNTIICAFASEDIAANSGAITGVTDTNGNTYTKDAANVNTGQNGDRVRVYSVPNCLGGASNKITANTTGSAYITFLGAIEVSGLLTSSYLDGSGGTATGNGSSSSQSTGTFSTTNANDLLVGAFGSSGIDATATDTVPSGFTEVAHHFNGGTDEAGSFVYQIVSSTQSGINPTWSLSGNTKANYWAGVGLAYKASGGAAQPTYGFAGIGGIQGTGQIGIAA